MRKSKQLKIDNLGIATIRPLSLGVMEHAYKHSLQYEEGKRALEFTNFVLSYLLEEPQFKPDEFASLSEETVFALIELAVDEWGIRGSFDSQPKNLIPQKRFYSAYRKAMKEIGESPRNFAVNISGFNASIQNAYEVIADNLKVHQDSMIQAREVLNGLAGRYRTTLQRTFSESIDRQLKEEEAGSKALNLPLTQAGFWIPPSAPFGLRRLLKTLVDDGKATPENVRQVFVQFYEMDDYYDLRSMVEEWEENPFFAARMRVIRDALEAHINGKYTLSIPSLLPIVEGILTEIVGRPATVESLRKWSGNAISELYTDIFRESSKDIVVQYITGITVYGKVPSEFFTPSKYPGWLTAQGQSGDQVLQRHGILHGIQVDYASKENSLRAFLLIDVLYWLKREEWDNNFRRLIK